MGQKPLSHELRIRIERWVPPAPLSCKLAGPPAPGVARRRRVSVAERPEWPHIKLIVPKLIGLKIPGVFMTEPLHQFRSALAERYTIERELGRGGMATVYLAEDLKHGRQVAVKVLRPGIGRRYRR